MPPKVTSQKEGQFVVRFHAKWEFYVPLFLFTGVIIPTLWLFLRHTFNASESYYSIVLSAFSFSSLIASPFFGAWIDFTRKTKITLLFGLLFEIGGMTLY